MKGSVSLRECLQPDAQGCWQGTRGVARTRRQHPAYTWEFKMQPTGQAAARNMIAGEVPQGHLQVQPRSADAQSCHS